MDSYQKRRKPGYYSNKSKKPRNFTLEPGLKGFICTCNIREKDCIREAYNILNEYADQLYGNERESRNWRERPEKANEESDGEIETALSNEIESIKAESKKTVDGRRFQVVESGANNCLFIRTNLDDPVDLMQHILKDIETSKKQKTRFLLRMIPIEVTCKAYLDDIKEKVSVLFDKYFTKEEKTFSIIINRRNSNMVSRDDAIAELAEMIKMRNINNRVDLKQPQLTVIIEVIRSMCCIGILPDYFRFRKYNLLELASPEGKKGDEDSAQKDSSGEPAVNEEEKASPCDSAGNVDTSEENGKGQDCVVTKGKPADGCNEEQSSISSECQLESTDDTKNDIKSQSQDATIDPGAGTVDVTESGNGDSLSQKTENCAIDTK
ncbi:THUMP domain-containing protein 1 homolog [Schistocerca cancellata]|uniref:THUMP domain-containing protein 1 homolog n=1 Tax=Schistocerca cancellata TaxID=274614 RepID=UPI002117DE38|nr:THUMP domain-containing protein 1 homolog [Schistocerca cancellata]